MRQLERMTPRTAYLPLTNLPDYTCDECGKALFASADDEFFYDKNAPILKNFICKECASAASAAS